MTKIVCTECSSGKLCQLTDFNPDSESDLDFNSDSDKSCLVSFYRWKTLDKHVTKIRIIQLVYCLDYFY